MEGPEKILKSGSEKVVEAFLRCCDMRLDEEEEVVDESSEDEPFWWWDGASSPPLPWGWRDRSSAISRRQHVGEEGGRGRQVKGRQADDSSSGKELANW